MLNIVYVALAVQTICADCVAVPGAGRTEVQVNETTKVCLENWTHRERRAIVEVAGDTVTVKMSPGLNRCPP